MEYLITFLEGIIAFISPCFLPMLPIYLSYFAGQDLEDNKYGALKNALGFVLGFTAIFTLLGAFAGSVGMFLRSYQTIVNIIGGIIVILFGLNFMGTINIPFLNRTVSHQGAQKKELRFTSSILFGVVFAVGWSPCMGAFLGSALMLAASSGTVIKGVLLLLTFSLGLGVPFILSGVLIDKLKNAFDFIKRHYKIINTVSGILLIIIGILMMTGLMDKLLSYLSI